MVDNGDFFCVSTFCFSDEVYDLRVLSQAEVDAHA
jgi:hypothetical protein